MLQASFRDAHLPQFKEEQVRAWEAGWELTSQGRATRITSFLASGTFTWKCGGLGPRVSMWQCRTLAVKVTRGQGGTLRPQREHQ